MKKALQDWMNKNPDKRGKSGRPSQFETFEVELKALLEAGYTTAKIAQYLEEVEKVKFAKKDGKPVLTTLNLYLRNLAAKHSIKRAGRQSKSAG